MASELVVTVIPVHKRKPTTLETIALKQCVRVLGRHPLKIIAPRGLDVGLYAVEAPDAEFIFIDPHWQSSLIWYNKLKKSLFFYKLFDKYQNLLTYELDAFVFRDELIKWCERGFDYVGAPWFEGYHHALPDANLKAVGNSGFSLRNVQTARKVISSAVYVDLDIQNSGMRNKIKSILKHPVYKLANYFGENLSLQTSNVFEDRFFSELVPQKFSSFKIPPVTVALEFAFEANPRQAFVLNHDHLPFGCHAWWRYDLAFWKPYIESYGYTLPA